MSDTTPQPVSRKRRFRFISLVVAYCLITAGVFTAGIAWVGIGAVYLPIVELYISGVLSLAVATTLAYVSGSVVDYNGGFGNMFTRSAPATNNITNVAHDPEAKG
jgi:hypothetical protein